MANLGIKYVFFGRDHMKKTSMLTVRFESCRYGKSLVLKYRNYQTVEQGIMELILRLEHHWLKTESQVKFLRSVGLSRQSLFRSTKTTSFRYYTLNPTRLS